MTTKLKIAYLVRQENNAIAQIDTSVIAHLSKITDVDFQVFRFPFRKITIFNPIVFIQTIANVVRLRSFDIVHISTFDSFFSIIIPFIRLSKKPLVCVTLYHLRTNMFFMLNIVLYRILKLCNVYVVGSKFTKNQLVKYLYVNDKQVFVTPIGIINKFNFCKKADFYPHPYILNVGGEYKRKNLITFIKGFELFLKENQQGNLRFVKRGQAVNDKDLDKCIRNSSALLDKVDIKRGQMSSEELSIFYSNAEFYVSPSTLEGFGLTVVEAMRCKCIPIVSAIDTFKEFDLPRICYVENYNDPQAWNHKIREIVNLSPHEKSYIKEKVYQISLYYDQENFCRNLLSSYIIMTKS